VFAGDLALVDDQRGDQRDEEQCAGQEQGEQDDIGHAGILSARPPLSDDEATDRHCNRLKS
jgi:hypothetical protein